jgi:hypothetical protein
MMGVINGAMIMAPMIAGALLAKSPKVAIAADKASRKKKLADGTDAAVRSLSTASAGTVGSI